MKIPAPKTESFAAVAWRAGRLRLLDQRRLPREIIYLDYDSAPAVAAAITSMVVRGAPAIGIAAAYAVTLAARAAWRKAHGAWRREIEADLNTLAAARPTAVNLRWAIEKMRRACPMIAGDPEPVLLALARQIHNDDIAANHEMGRLGAALLATESRVVTHCNAGALATGGYGTALGVIREAHASGLLERVYVSETRPALQGARLTCWELRRARIPHELLVDTAIAGLMRSGRIHWLIVGADRIAANGDVANKTGTYAHALAAKYHAVKVMVVAPAATVDLALKSGAEIPIEYRAPLEVTAINGGPIAPAGVTACNPAFDVTPAALVDALVSERGILERPGRAKMLAVFGAPDSARGNPD